MNITGKVTTTAINTEIEFLVDDKKLSSGLSNEDGLFNANIDTSNLTDGTHFVKN